MILFAGRRGFIRSGEGGDAAAFGFEFVMFAEARDVLFYLDFEIREGRFADVGEMLAFFGCVERAAGKCQRKREAEFLGSRNSGKNTVKLDEIRVEAFQQFGEFIHTALQCFFSRSMTFDFFENDREFHICTCRISLRKRDELERGATSEPRIARRVGQSNAIRALE